MERLIRIFLINTSISSSGKSDSDGQSGGVNDHLCSKIEIEDSSDDECVQEVVHEMKDV